MLQERADPVVAALGAARALGLPTATGELVHVGTHALVRLEPGPIAARVTADGVLAPFAGDLDAEVRLAAALVARGAPVVPPLAGVPARVHAHVGRRITFWTWWERPGAEDEPAACGRALATCHRALVASDPATVPLRPWVRLAEARRRLPRLPARERALLTPHLSLPVADLRPIHGDAHAGNVLPGPAWHDWEDAQLGWAEWDLACFVAPGRVVGMDFGHGEAVLAGYDEPYDEERLDRCVLARTALQAADGLLLAGAVPGLADRVAVRLEWLAAQTGA